MRTLIFGLILNFLKSCQYFQGENGTIRIYDFPNTAPDGYPYAVLGSESLESSILDNASDTRRYNYVIQVVGEKFGVEAGLSQSDALTAMRAVEDAVLAIFDNNNSLKRQDVVIRTMPTAVTWGTTDNGGRIVLNINMQVDARVLINYNP